MTCTKAILSVPFHSKRHPSFSERVGFVVCPYLSVGNSLPDDISGMVRSSTSITCATRKRANPKASHSYNTKTSGVLY